MCPRELIQIEAASITAIVPFVDETAIYVYKIDDDRAGIIVQFSTQHHVLQHHSKEINSSTNAAN